MGGQDYASPVAGDGKIYFVTRSGDIHVLRASSAFESLAVNRLTDEAEDFSATPAISDGQLFIRSSKHLYCIEQ
jgi:outer membrane protein assembly factor BamB